MYFRSLPERPSLQVFERKGLRKSTVMTQQREGDFSQEYRRSTPGVLPRAVVDSAIETVLPRARITRMRLQLEKILAAFVDCCAVESCFSLIASIS